MAVSQVVVVDGNNLIVRIDRGVAGRGVTDVEPIEIDGSLYLVFTFSDGTTETIGPVGTIQYIGQSPIVVTGSTISLSTVPVTLGGTGQITANAGFNALAPSQTGNSGKYLKTDGTNSAWDLLDISTADITGVLPLANGGTGSSTASGARTNLGLGTIATQNANAISITGGTITGITDLAVADGGTGASTAAGAMVNLLPSYTGNANKRLGLDSTATGLEWVTDGGGTVTSVDVSGGSTGLLFTGGPVTTSGTITLSGTLDVDNGGTGATTATDARTNLGAAASAITINAGTGLSGGGDLTANRTLSITNTGVTAASYGSASNTLTATVNAQGQLTTLAATPIAISNTQVSGLGTMSTQNSNNVTITGGSITGITDLAIADGGTGASTAADARSNLGLGTAAVLNAGVANGVATLDAGGTVPLSQIPASIQGGVNYQGSWNAATNTPTIVSGVGSKGYYYVVSVAGSTNIDGITDWLPGDWIIFNGTTWEQIDNTDAVASVNGYTGVVVLTNTDVNAPPTSLTISAGTGLTGGGNLTTNRTLSIANTTVSAASYGTASAVPTFTVNGQGQLTAASDVTIAIANTQVSGLGTMSTQNANNVTITGGSITGITDLAIADGGTGASTAGGALTNLGAIGSITSSDGSIIVVPSGTSVDLAVSAASPASTLLTQVRNTTGATLAKGTVVYISGATGQISTVSKAIATGDTTSAQTLGMITADLANNTNGYVTVFGLITNIDTSSYTDGAQLYLSGTVAGGVTTTKPYAPTHLVYVGIVEYAHPTQGKILVKVQNGYELDELHNVSAQSPSNGQTIVYNSSNSLWENNTVSLAIGVNGTLPIANGGTGQTTANAAFNALAPSQTGNSGKYLTTDGTDTSWASNPLGTVTSVAATVPSFLSISGSPITTSGTLAFGLSGTALPTTSGGTGLTSFTSGGVVYASSSSALATGSALTFDGTNGGTSGLWSVGNLTSVSGGYVRVNRADNATYNEIKYATGDLFYFNQANGGAYQFNISGSEQMRLNSTGLGVGTNNPLSKLHIESASAESVRIGYSSTKTARLGTTSSGDLQVYAYDSAVGYRNILLAVDSTTSVGNVGIGTSSPSYKLDVLNSGTTWARLGNGGSNSGAGLILAGASTSKNWVISNEYNISGALEFTQTTVAGGSTIGSSAALTLSSSGNLGLGVTPSAWYSGTKAIQLLGASFTSTATTGYLYQNSYLDSGTQERFYADGYASKATLSSGGHQWFTAPSGTAGNAISFNQAMTLFPSGNLGVGNTSDSYKITAYGSSPDIVTFHNGANGTRGYITSDNNAVYIGSTYSSNGVPIIFAQGGIGAGGAERGRFDSSGALIIGSNGANDWVSYGGISQFRKDQNSPALLTISNQSSGSSGSAGILLAAYGNSWVQSIGTTAKDNNALTWALDASASPPSEKMRLTTSGYLGIGTNNPLYKLDVDGNFRIANINSGGTLTGYFGCADTGSITLNFGGTTTPSKGRIFYTDNSDFFSFYTNSTERMVLNSSGNLGLGVVPSAWKSTWKSLDVGTAASFYSQDNNTTGIGSNLYFSGTNWYRKNTGLTALYQLSEGAHYWYSNATGSSGSTFTPSSVMTLDAGGNLALGTNSSPSGIFRFVSYQGNSNYTLGLQGSSKGFRTFDNTSEYRLEGVDSTLTASYQPVAFGAGGYIRFLTTSAGGGSLSEGARIDSSGNLLVGTDTFGQPDVNGAAIGKADGAFRSHHATGTASGTIHAYFTYGGLGIGSISQSGTTAVAYNTSSDYRLKNTIAPMTGALAKVALLKPCTYKWNADGSDGEGFIAHELAEVVPQCVTGEKDAVDEEGNPKYQGIDTSFLVATLTAAIQEQQAIIESLKARLDAANL